jgi:tetratricopeptide (TPR) repeat protein
MMRQKIEQKTGLPGEQNVTVLPCLGSLYGINWPGTAAVEPELRKARLHDAIKTIFKKQAQRSPTVICLEDIHWADPSSAELIHSVFSDLSYPVLLICTLRPTPHFPPVRELSCPELMCREITLTSLTAEESRELLKSLLKSSDIPSALESFILEKVEGNPFYLEEILNALIESAALVKKKGAWQLTTPLTHSRIPRTVHGLIASRIDCLHPTAKRILQVASVMGKRFPSTILTKITDGAKHLEDHLERLEQNNLIRRTSAHPDPEYSFRHAIIQEVVYSSLLKKERQEIHERIGLVIENLFTGRLEVIPETLAFHFKHGKSLHKAAHYLVQSGKKSLQQYAVNESHQYYREAYDLFNSSGRSSMEGKTQLIELLNTWAPVFYFRGTFRDLEELLRRHLAEAETLDDLEKRGIFYVWLGASMWGGEQFRDAYCFLHRALELGERSTSNRVIAYAHTWLAWTCVELGRIEEGITHGGEARALSVSTAWEHYPYFQSYDSDGYAYWALGACAKIKASGEKLRELGQQSASIRGITWGYTVEAWGFASAGDFPSAIAWTQVALKTSKDPLYTQFPRLSLGMCYVLSGDYEKAKQPLMEVLEFAENRGCRYLGTPAQCFLAAVLTAEGRFREGMSMLKRAQRWWSENQALWRCTFSELIIGDIYAALARRETPISWSILARNAFFLAKNLPFAAGKARDHYLKAIESANRIGAQVIEGQAYLSLGRFYMRGGKNRQASACFSSASRLFELCEAGVYLEQARRELSLVEGGKERFLRR